MEGYPRGRMRVARDVGNQTARGVVRIMVMLLRCVRGCQSNLTPETGHHEL